MAIVYVDGFEHYGGVKANLSLGTGWSDINSGTTLSTSHKRTGSYSLLVQGRERLIFGKSLSNLGLCMGVLYESLPTNAYSGFVFRDVGNVAIVAFVVMPNGSIVVRRGDIESVGSSVSTVIGTTDSIIFAGTFNHIEAKINVDSIVGSVEIRVNGVRVLLLEDLDLGSSPATLFQANVGWQGNGGTSYYIDDYILWDDTGSYNNDFLGQQRVLTIFPNGDGTEADWSITGGSGPGYDAIDELAQDGDTSYVRADTVGDKSSFTLPDLPTETAAIRALFVPAMGRIDDAGVGNIKVSMISGTDVLGGTDINLTPNYSYSRSVFEYDPATNEAWTKEGVEAALIRLEKTL